MFWIVWKLSNQTKIWSLRIMGRTKLIDIVLLEEMLLEGKSQVECAAHFGVSQPAISVQIKRLGIEVVRNAAAGHASVVVEKKLNAIEQLQKINENANELLDLCMRWQRGDEEALRILESQIKHVMVGSGADKEAVKQYKFKDPRELALKAMNEIRNQLRLQLEILKTLYDAEAVKEFQNELIALLGEVDQDVRNEFIRRLREKGALRSILEFDS